MHLHAKFCSLLNEWNWVWPYCAFEIPKNGCECSLLHWCPLLRCFNGCELGCRFSADFISDLQLPPLQKDAFFLELQLHLSSVLWLDFKRKFLEKYFDFYPKFGFQISWAYMQKFTNWKCTVRNHPLCSFAHFEIGWSFLSPECW